MPPSVTLIGHYPPPYGGVASLMREMEGALTAAGWRVDVFNLGHGRPEAPNVTNFDTTHRVREVLELRRAIAGSGSRVLHYLSASYRSFWLGTVCLALASLARRPMVVSFVGGAFPDFIGSLGPLKRWWARIVLYRAAALIACNDEIAATLKRLVPRAAVRHISNSFPVARPGTGRLPDDVEGFLGSHRPVVSTTGAAQPEYGLPGAVRAIALLREDLPDLGLVIVLTPYGTAEHEDEIRDAVTAAGLEGRVLITRGLPEFVALLDRSDAFLRSALVDGDSMSVREALYLGVPTVASDTAFRPPGVTAFRRADVEDMAGKLREALSRGRGDPSSARRESERNLEALLEIYTSVAGAGASVRE
jgi:glycogen(starch) synthase